MPKSLKEGPDRLFFHETFSFAGGFKAFQFEDFAESVSIGSVFIFPAKVDPASCQDCRDVFRVSFSTPKGRTPRALYLAGGIMNSGHESEFHITFSAAAGRTVEWDGGCGSWEQNEILSDTKKFLKGESREGNNFQDVSLSRRSFSSRVGNSLAE